MCWCLLALDLCVRVSCAAHSGAVFDAAVNLDPVFGGVVDVWKFWMRSEIESVRFECLVMSSVVNFMCLI